MYLAVANAVVPRECVMLHHWLYTRPRDAALQLTATQHSHSWARFSVSWKAEHSTFLSFDFSPTVAFTVWTLQFGIFVNLAIKIPTKFSANCSNSPCWIYRPITSHNSKMVRTSPYFVYENSELRSALWDERTSHLLWRSKQSAGSKGQWQRNQYSILVLSVHNLTVSKSLREWNRYQVLKSLSAFEIVISFRSRNLLLKSLSHFENIVCFWSLYQFLKSLFVFEVFISFWSLYQFLKSLPVFEVIVCFWSFYLFLKSVSIFEIFIRFGSLYLFLKFLSVFEVVVCFWSLYQFLKSLSVFEVFIYFWSLYQF